MNPRAGLAALALGGALAAGCAEDPVNLGPDPDFAWWSDLETGDTTDWTRGAGTVYPFGGGTLSVQTGIKRSGKFALVSTVPAGGGPMVAALVTREEMGPPDAYFGAWFYVPAFARPATYWVVFAFHAGDDAALWDLKLTPNAAGDLTLQLFEHASALDLTALAMVTVPLGRWFQVQAYYRAHGDASDVLRIWQDDQVLYEIAGPDAAGTGGVKWSLGTITDGLTPGATIYIDDAFIAARRIDPHAPPFWRAP
jgi:hypothetical protein